MRFLFERVQNVDRLSKLRYVKDAIFRISMNPNLVYTWADSWHRPPVVGLEPQLNKVKLMPNLSSRVLRKRSDIIKS